MRILIIDDDADNLDMLEACFTDVGFRVSTAVEVINIYALLKQYQPDLVLMDYQLTRGNCINGGELCQQIKLFPRTCKLPVILMSACCIAPALLKDYCFDLFVEKPFDIHELVASSRQLISLSGYNTLRL